MKLIKKSAMVIVKDNKLLVVRKRGSPDFLMPGGKPERNESPIEALKRELIGEPKPASEIEELGWISAADAISPNLTPIIKRQILPFLLQKGMLR